MRVPTAIALMQHHGAPTRLLDFTWSPFVAAFFALERATTDCAVWAVSYPKLWGMKHQFPQEDMKHVFPGEQAPVPAPAPRTKEIYHRLFLADTVPFVATGEPFDMNERLIAQSGTFLIPGVLHPPVEGIIASYPNPETTIVKFVLRSSKIRDAAMENLNYMNITNATLFPGLDGMARSLAYELEFHWGFNPKTMDEYAGYKFVRPEDS